MKTDEDGNEMKYKARLVVKGFLQKAGVDFTETFAPVARLPTIRLLLSLTSHFGFKIYHLDVTTAFLHGELDKEIYMRPPETVQIPDGHLLRLLKTMYGLKQSPRQWNLKFHRYVPTLGFIQSIADYCIYVRTCSKGVIILLLYVDDILLCGDDKNEIAKVRNQLSFEYKMKDLEVVKGLNVTIDQESDTPRIDQSHYAEKFRQQLGTNRGRVSADN